MAFSIASAGAAARGYERGIDMLADRKRQMGIEGREQERHGVLMDDADYRQRARAPADVVRGDVMQGIDYRQGQRTYEEGTRKPVEAVQARHTLDDERASNAEARAQAQAGRAEDTHAYNLAARVPAEKKRRAEELSLEMRELDAENHRAIAPLIQAGKKEEAFQAMMGGRQKTYETMAATFYELGPEAVVDAFNAWGGSKVTDAVDFRQVDTPEGKVFAFVDADGKVIEDPTMGKPLQVSEEQLKALHARHKVRNAPKDGSSKEGKKAKELMALGVPQDVALATAYGAVKEIKDVSGNVTLVDTLNNRPIGSMQMGDDGSLKWTGAAPAEGGGSARPPGAPRPAIGEGPQPPQAHLDKLREAMNAGDPALRKLRQQQFDAVYGPGSAMHWMGQIDSKQKATAAQQQQESRRQQEQQQAVQQAQSLLKVVDGPGIAPRGPDEPANEADAQFVEFFDANRDKLAQADRGMMLEMLPAYRNARARLENAPKGIDPAAQKRDDFLGGIDAPSVPGVVFGRPQVPR